MVAAGAALLWTVNSSRSTPAQISEKDNGSTISLASGSAVRISLRGYAVASGQSADVWGPLVSSDQGVIEVVQDTASFRLPWDAPVTAAKLVARSPGKAQVTSTICNPRAAGCGRFVITVVVTLRSPQ